MQTVDSVQRLVLQLPDFFADLLAFGDEAGELFLDAPHLAPFAVTADGEIHERHRRDDADRAADEHEDVDPAQKRKKVRTWHLIDLKLGSYVRGQGALILLVGTILSVAFWAIHEPYWLLLGSFAGFVEIVPVVGPLSAGVLAVGVGLTASWGVALAAGIVVLVQRQLEDYLIAPRGSAVQLVSHRC